jgi:hypothetical protein
MYSARKFNSDDMSREAKQARYEQRQAELQARLGSADSYVKEQAAKRNAEKPKPKRTPPAPPVRKAGVKLQNAQPRMTQAPPIRRINTNEAFENSDVTRSEARAIDLIRSELNPRLINVDAGKYGVDVATDIGNIDIQYSNNPNPFIDLMSHGHLRGYPKELAPYSEAQAIHNLINNDIYHGSNLTEVVERLNSLGVTMGGPQSTGFGKLLNVDNYPAVAVMQKQGQQFTNPRVIDMLSLNRALTEAPMRDLGAKVYFNNKRKYARSANDTFESAMISLQNPNVLRDFDITNRFF